MHFRKPSALSLRQRPSVETRSRLRGVSLSTIPCETLVRTKCSEISNITLYQPYQAKTRHLCDLRKRSNMRSVKTVRLV